VAAELQRAAPRIVIGVVQHCAIHVANQWSISKTARASSWDIMRPISSLVFLLSAQSIIDYDSQCTHLGTQINLAVNAGAKIDRVAPRKRGDAAEEN
jgi:hypothetical protein